MTLAHPPLTDADLEKLSPRVVTNYGVGVNHIDLDAVCISMLAGFAPIVLG